MQPIPLRHNSGTQVYWYYRGSTMESITYDMNSDSEFLHCPAINSKGDKVNPLPWNFSYTKQKYCNGRATRWDQKNGFTGVLSETSVFVNSASILSELSSRVTTEALDKLLSSLQSADWASNVAEAAADGFSNPIRQITDLAVDQRMEDARSRAHGQTFHIKNPTRRWRIYNQIIARAWLQLQYLWKPAVQDIWNTADAISRNLNNGIKVSGRSSATENLATGQLFAAGSYVDCRVSGSISARCLYAGKISINDIGLAPTLTSMDPRVIAWNLLPYSFVVDWFYDMGGYLQNLEAACMFAPAWHAGYMTTSFKQEYTGSCHEKLNVAETYKITAEASVLSKGMTRTLLHSLPKPTLPSPTVDLSSGRLINAAALLAASLGATSRR